MIRPGLRAKAVAKAKARARRPPGELMEVLTEPEQDFRRMVERLESHHLFARLESLGVVRRRRVMGRIPLAQYQMHMDAHLVRFLDRYGVSERPEWHAEFTSVDARRNVEALARKYGAPVGEVRRFVRYLGSTSYGSEGNAPVSRAESAPPRADLGDYLRAQSDADVDDAVPLGQVFVQEHGVTEVEFVRDFLWGDESPEVLAERYGAEADEVRELLQSLESAQVVSAMSAESAPRIGVPSPRAVDDGLAEMIVADVEYAEGGTPCLRFDAAADYTLRYNIAPGALERDSALRDDPEVEQLLSRLRWVNQRRSVVSRIVTFIFEHQRQYFGTRDPLALRPLTQAEIAHGLGEYQSTISRAVRQKALRSPEGVFELQYFCQSKAEVIGRLAMRFPMATAEAVRRMLLERYQCQISRRTVAYHLHRLRTRGRNRGGGAKG